MLQQARHWRARWWGVGQPPVDSSSDTQVTNPLEPLIVGLIKGYINDSDLSTKLSDLYQVSQKNAWSLTRLGHCVTRSMEGRALIL
jgi:hypothetical protein